MNTNDNKKPLSDDEIRKKVARLRKAKAVSRPIAWAFSVLAALIYLWEVKSQYQTGIGVLLVLIVSILVILFLCLASYLGYQDIIRAFVSKSLVPELLREKFTNFIYNAKKGVNWKLVKSVNMLDDFSYSRCQNHFIGLYKGRKVEFSDVWLYTPSVSLSGGGGHRTTLFRGPWMTFDYGVQVPTRVKIRGRTGNFAIAPSNVITPNAAFNARFQVTADNPHLAYALLTPQFIERIMKFGGRTRMCFEPGRVHFAFNTNRDSRDECGKDSGRYIFEVTGEEWEMADLDGLRDKFRQEIRYLTDIIDIICEGDGYQTRYSE